MVTIGAIDMYSEPAAKMAWAAAAATSLSDAPSWTASIAARIPASV